jgi:polyisoprenoid-binding protein YceI
MSRASLLLLAALSACAKDPTAGRARAVAAAPATESAAPAKAERVALGPGPMNDIGFVGAKITAQERGHFADFGGTVDLVNGDPQRSRVELEVQCASLSVESGVEDLEHHLRSPDFLDCARFPVERFVSTSIVAAKDGYQVTGNLEIRGVKKSISFPATIDVGADVVVVAEIGINRKDFGVEYPGMADDLIKDNVLITVKLHAPRPVRT